MDIGLSDRVILITGAASGIGAAIAAAAAAAGATVCGLDREAEGVTRLIAGLPGQGHSAMIVDLVSADDAARAVPEAVASHGRIDGLVNAAALTTRAGFDAGASDLWDSLFAVNARAPYLLMSGAIADMRRRGEPGGIVNILSVNAHCGRPDLAIYSATKGALSTLTRNAAHAHMADRIRVNGINLGWVDTPSEHRLQADVLGNGPDWAARAAAAMPLGRLVSAEDCGRLALYLLADASAPLTGALIDLEQHVLGAPQ